MNGQRVWLSRWQGNSPTTMFDSEDFPDIAALRSQWFEVVIVASIPKALMRGRLPDPSGLCLQVAVLFSGQVVQLRRQPGVPARLQ